MNKIFNKKTFLKKLLSAIVSGLILGVVLVFLSRYTRFPADNWLMFGIAVFTFTLIWDLLPLLWKKRNNTKADR